ncbi:cystinosin homolog [Ctenocephalides felis]|uniref:cystinosin homolog n=1 Tax=Ctenocephalides felis TaxID=7515 RepID=UPI000E6E37CB|nr:cystinosin homolog [Ctenocephalides felis]
MKRQLEHLFSLLVPGLFLTLTSTVFLWQNAAASSDDTFVLSTHDITILVGDVGAFNLEVRRQLVQPVQVNFYAEHKSLLRIKPAELEVSDPGSYNISLKGINPGFTVITYNVSQNNERRDLINVFLWQNAAASSDDTFVLSTHDITILVGDVGAFNLEVRRQLVQPVQVNFYAEHKSLLRIKPAELEVSDPGSYNISLKGINPGFTVITYNVSQNNERSSRGEQPDDFIRVIVQHSTSLGLLSVVVGWIYFIAWSVSFYPQIYSNFRRKSVVGLNFDFVGLNLIGFCLYTVFNIGLYFVPTIEQEYFDRNPRGLNPVQINDVVFSVHAALATFLTIIQCIFYERGNQRVSIIGSILMGTCFILVIVSGSLAASYVIEWLDFLYYCSYIKLGITLVKYIPQAYMNYKRKSTVGWSIGNIFLDFAGGLTSMLQMIINAYNYDDWISIFGDPTKFGLGLFSVIFDIFFMIQHYVLYSSTEKSKPETINTI